MSKNETWRTIKYWEKTGGLLILEFIAAQKKATQGLRSMDGLIVLNETKEIYGGRTFDIKNKDVIIIQTKASRLGMGLLGQAHFSKLLIEKHQPRSIRSVAICSKTDALLEQFAHDHGVEIVIIRDDEKTE